MLDSSIENKVCSQIAPDAWSVDGPMQLLSEDNSFGLPLGIEAPIMTPDGVNL